MKGLPLMLMLVLLVLSCSAQEKPKSANSYPAVWFAPINDPNKPDWEILPQEAKAGEVILSKRNELGILSNFAATHSRSKIGNVTNLKI